MVFALWYDDDSFFPPKNTKAHCHPEVKVCVIKGVIVCVSCIHNGSSRKGSKIKNFLFSLFSLSNQQKTGRVEYSHTNTNNKYIWWIAGENRVVFNWLYVCVPGVYSLHLNAFIQIAFTFPFILLLLSVAWSISPVDSVPHSARNMLFSLLANTPWVSDIS